MREGSTLGFDAAKAYYHFQLCGYTRPFTSLLLQRNVYGHVQFHVTHMRCQDNKIRKCLVRTGSPKKRVLKELHFMGEISGKGVARK